MTAADPWALYARHRARQQALLLAAAPASGTLALLGAGRCRDVDLDDLTDRYRQVHLVDVERAYLDEAWARQPAAVQARLVLHARVELSGLVPLLPLWHRTAPDDDTLEAWSTAAPETIAALLPRCDVVASTCLLSQLSYQLTQVLGREHPALERVRRAMVRSHLRLLATLTRPGGTFLLVSDLAAAPRGQLETRLLTLPPRALIEELAAEGALFRGTIPDVIEGLLAEDPLLQARIRRAETPEPWLWTRTADRTHLVYALRAWC